MSKRTALEGAPVTYEGNGKVYRRYTPDWGGTLEKTLNSQGESERLIKTALLQRKYLIAYIESLHNEIDKLNNKTT